MGTRTGHVGELKTTQKSTSTTSRARDIEKELRQLRLENTQLRNAVTTAQKTIESIYSNVVAKTSAGESVSITRRKMESASRSGTSARPTRKTIGHIKIDEAALKLTHAANLTAFEKLLPALLADHRGEYALMRKGELKFIYKNAGDALIEGDRMYKDRLFSIQIIDTNPFVVGAL